MKIADTDILFVPGHNRPNAGHWQSRWADKLSTGHWVEPKDWTQPDFEDRVGGLHQAVLMATRPVVVVAHSLGVLSLVHAAARLTDTKVRGAFLVCPPDLASLDAEQDFVPFAATSVEPLPFASMLIASETDPCCTLERAAEFAAIWGSDFHNAGDAGHIDTASGHGPWPEGLMMFTRLMQRLKA